MAAYSLPRSDRPQLAEILGDSGRISVQSMDGGPITIPGMKWWRLICDAGAARAAVSICEHERQPESIIVDIGTDLRRILFFWRLPGDVRLVRRLNRLLECHGAVLIPQVD